jgi:chromate reductase, NAD(P)H dehydrogenase (quinone)
MTTLIGLSGSLRKQSYNTALLHAAASLLPDAVTLDVHTIHGIPLFNEDDEAASGIPAPVAKLKAAIAAADGLLLATPEYNGTMPGPFKNAIDWLSRPGTDIPKIFGGKPVALMGATPGGGGTVLSQISWLPLLSALGTKPWFGSRLLVPAAYQSFDASGQLTDVALRKKLQEFMAGFAQFAAPIRR